MRQRPSTVTGFYAAGLWRLNASDAVILGVEKVLTQCRKAVRVAAIKKGRNKSGPELCSRLNLERPDGGGFNFVFATPMPINITRSGAIGVIGGGELGVKIFHTQAQAV